MVYNESIKGVYRGKFRHNGHSSSQLHFYRGHVPLYFSALYGNHLRICQRLKCIPFVFDTLQKRIRRSTSVRQIRVSQAQNIVSMLYVSGMFVNLAIGPLSQIEKFMGFPFLMIFLCATIVSWNVGLHIAPAQIVNSFLALEDYFDQMGLPQPPMSLDGKIMKMFIPFIEVSIASVAFLIPVILTDLGVVGLVVHIFETWVALNTLYAGSLWIFYILFVASYVSQPSNEVTRGDHHHQVYYENNRLFKTWCDYLDLDCQNVSPKSMICDTHFEDDQFNNSKRIRLKPTTLPSRFGSQQQLLQASTPSKVLQAGDGRSVIKFIPILPKQAASIPVSPPSLDVSQPEIRDRCDSPCSPSSSVSSPRPQSNISSPETSPSSTTDNKKRIRQLQQKLRRSRAKIRPEKIMESLNKVMNNATSLKPMIISHLQRLTSRKLRKVFTQEEKVTAITIYFSTTKRGYKTLQKLGLNLPSISTINLWLRHLDISTGINPCIEEILRDRVKDMNNFERDCVLMFDEMAIKKYLLYDKNRDKLIGIQDHGPGRRKLVPASEALVFMVRGLNTNWIQPFSYHFSQDSTTSEDLRLSVAAGIKTLIELPEDTDRKMSEDARPTADFLIKMDSIFDLLNTSSRHVVGKPLNSANQYTNNIDHLRSFRKWVSEWQMGDGTKIVDSVRALQLTLHSVELLLTDLETDGYGYVFTRRIQQDILE
ncbi:Transposable element P transposase [Folsomia candida]|uniref:Transposable element P transposase n=1 Tax=Folsomia candida TaxID=158441 RepID=A0A226D9E4_FOLCA|nr:Transposable element P transposase [Folsomia candida]